MSITKLNKQLVHFNNVTFKGEPKVNLSQQVWDKIQHLCKVINKVEWSGVMFYEFTHENPTLSNNETLDVNVVDLIPLDMGTTGYTEYSFDARVIQYMTEMNYFHLKIGHIHSHHNMATFFSGTDMSELNENSEFIKPYLSLIVNNKQEFACKIGFRIIEENTYTYQDISGSEITVKYTNSENTVSVGVYDCKVVLPTVDVSLPLPFLNQVSEITKPKPVIKPQYINKISNVKSDTKQMDLFENYHSFFNDYEPYNIDEIDFGHNLGPSLLELEKMSCYILRLGNMIENDSLDGALEDLEHSINSNNINFDKYCKQVHKNIFSYIKQFWKKPEMSDEEIYNLVFEFTDELRFAQTEFLFLDNLIELLDKLYEL